MNGMSLIIFFPISILRFPSFFKPTILNFRFDIPFINSSLYAPFKEFNFESILAVAFSVNSKRALKVRRWANKTLVNALATDIKL